MSFGAKIVLAVIWSATLLAIGALLAMSAIDNEPGRGWLYDYQTLVTGVLAVAAAGTTVFEMQRTDERQQRRHEDLVRLSLRADRLRVKRATIGIRQLRETTRVADGYTQLLKPATESRKPTELGLANTAEYLGDSVRKLILFTEDDHLEAASDLFGPELTAVRSELAYLGKTKLRAQDFKAVTDYLRSGSEINGVWEVSSDHLRRTIMYSERFALLCGYMADLLERLAVEYD